MMTAILRNMKLRDISLKDPVLHRSHTKVIPILLSGNRLNESCHNLKQVKQHKQTFRAFSWIESSIVSIHYHVCFLMVSSLQTAFMFGLQLRNALPVRIIRGFQSPYPLISLLCCFRDWTMDSRKGKDRFKGRFSLVF